MQRMVIMMIITEKIMGEGTYLENNALPYGTPIKQGTQGAYSTQQLPTESCHFPCPLQPTQLLCLSSEKQAPYHGPQMLIKNETKQWSTLPPAIIPLKNRHVSGCPSSSPERLVSCLERVALRILFFLPEIPRMLQAFFSLKGYKAQRFYCWESKLEIHKK